MSSMKWHAASVAAAMLVFSTIDAQAQDSALAPARLPQPLRIEVQSNVFVPMAAGASIEDQQAAALNVRRALYQTAEKECQVLTEIFKMSCRMINIRANTNFQTRGQGSEGIQASIGASFELKQPQQ